MRHRLETNRTGSKTPPQDTPLRRARLRGRSLSLHPRIRHYGAAKARAAAFTLVEVVISIAVMGLVFSGILLGYTQSARRAEWTGYSLAAQALAVQQLEQARAAVWDVSSTPIVNQFTNLPSLTWTNLDIPTSGTNFTRATNYITVQPITNILAPVYLVRVSTVWRFRGEPFTNQAASYYAPDQ